MKEIAIPDQVTLQCITLWQPWATWICWGWKSVETRTHRRFACLAGKRIGIHAGKHWDDSALDSASEFLSKQQLEQTKNYSHSFGFLICTAVVCRACVVDPRMSNLALIDCGATERHGLFLNDVQPIGPVIQAKGSQGIWSISLPADWLI